jgi:phage tail sheath gpL-like
VPTTERLRLEPVLFYSHSGVPGESQWRALLSAEQRVGGRSSFGLGVAGGQVRGSGRDGTVWDSFARVSASLGRGSLAHLMVRHERAPNTSALTSVSLGLSVVVSRP